ncbi:MAG: sulfatase [Candidatus Sumerlaeota bacterium]|nr:sulfatase [Candidatus Sumerlaeota bacterium]
MLFVVSSTTRATLASAALPLALAWSGALARAAEPPPAKKLNVLFIAVDDLRPELGCYGVAEIKSPNIDKLAGRGMLFNRAYCQQAVCNPSRASLLTGCRPDSIKVWDLQTHFRREKPDVVTLPQLFKENGWKTRDFGKIYHGGLEDPPSWTIQKQDPPISPSAYLNADTQAAIQAQRGKAAAQKKAAAKPAPKPQVEKDPKTGIILKAAKPASRVRGPAWEASETDDDSALSDGGLADLAIQALNEWKDESFFLAVGFHRPHLPFIAPKKYFDLYDNVAIPPAPNPFPPKDSPPLAWTSWGELRAYLGMPKTGPVSAEDAAKLKKAYYASVSYMDAQVGRVIDELDRLGLADSTVIVLWGDHGWQLGDHSFWCKHTNYEIADHAPLLLSVPGQKTAGARTDALVEFVDIYPTLCDLAGLAKPAHLEGTSMAPLLDDPNRPWKTAAFSQYPRGGDAMGYAMRTDRYRFVHWINRKTGDLIANELYDHQDDPLENVNLANRAENKGLVEQLTKQLEAGWKAAAPHGGSADR